jgi:hypothetical protein
MCKSKVSLQKYWVPSEVPSEEGRADSDFELTIQDDINHSIGIIHRRIGIKRGAGRGDRDCYRWSTLCPALKSAMILRRIRAAGVGDADAESCCLSAQETTGHG